MPPHSLLKGKRKSVLRSCAGGHTHAIKFQRSKMDKEPIHPSLKSDFPQPNGISGDQYSTWVLNTVDKFRPQRLTLPSNGTLKFGKLEDTLYNNCPDEVNKWGTFFLPTTVQMQVIGYVEGSPYPCDQLVLMTCEDKKIYAYDEEELHLVATSWASLRDNGLAYPALKSYYSGEAFKDMTREDWDEMRRGPVWKRLDEERQKFRAAQESTFLENLMISRQKQKCHEEYGNSLPDHILSQFVQRGGK